MHCVYNALCLTMQSVTEVCIAIHGLAYMSRTLVENGPKVHTPYFQFILSA